MAKFIYVAGPIGANDDGRINRVHAAIAVADDLWSMGMLPFLPHLCHWWDAVRPHGYEEWMEYDAAWLERCDAVYRMPGHSPGADREVAWAKENARPVFTDYDALKRWADGVSE